MKRPEKLLRKRKGKKRKKEQGEGRREKRGKKKTMVALLVSIVASFGPKNCWTQAVHLAVRLACVQVLEKEGKGSFRRDRNARAGGREGGGKETPVRRLLHFSFLTSTRRMLKS